MTTRMDNVRRDGVLYNDDLAAGWMVGHHYTSPGNGLSHTTFWFGPRSGWGTTSGPLSHPGPRVWPTKHDAEMALRRVFIKPSTWRGRRYEVMRVTAARELVAAQRAAQRAAGPKRVHVRRRGTTTATTTS